MGNQESVPVQDIEGRYEEEDVSVEEVEEHENWEGEDQLANEVEENDDDAEFEEYEEYYDEDFLEELENESLEYSDASSEDQVDGRPLKLHRKESRPLSRASSSKSLTNDADLVLSADEIEKAKRAFEYCDTHSDNFLTLEQFGHALALVGFVESSDIVRKIFLDATTDAMDFSTFTSVLSRMRIFRLAEDQLSRIQVCFDALYDGTCPMDTQRDKSGRKYILASDLRMLITNRGENKMSDEEADMLIKECHPIYENPHEGKIFFEQYRSMLLDIS